MTTTSSILKRKAAKAFDEEQDSSRSAVWKFFTVIEDPKEKDCVHAKCVGCGTIYRHKHRGSTSNMLRHLASCPTVPAKQSSSKRLKQTTLGVKCRKSHQYLQNKLLEAIIISGMSFNQAATPAFRQFLKELDPGFNPPSRKALRTCLDSTYDSVSNQVPAPLLASIPS